MKIFTIRVPTPSHDRLMAEAERCGLKRTEIIKRAIDDYLDRREAMQRERLRETADSATRQPA